MILDLLFLILLIPLSVIITLLQGISDVFTTVTQAIIPNGIFTSITTAIGYLGIFNGIFPIDTLIICIGALFTFYYYFYLVKLALWVWNQIPYLSTGNQDLPQANILDLRKSSSNARTLDLRKKPKGKISMKDIR